MNRMQPNLLSRWHGLAFYCHCTGILIIELGLPLSTFNQKHYAMLTGLVTMQPYSRTTS